MTTLIDTSPDPTVEPTPAPLAASTTLERPARRPSTWWLGFPLPLLILGFWQLGVMGKWVLPLGIRMGYLPTPIRAGQRLWDFAFGGIMNDAYSGTLWIHLLASTIRVMQGFGLAALVAIPLGILMGRNAGFFKLVEPTVNLIRPIPVTAWAPLTLLIIGFGDRSTMFLVFLAAVFPILLNTITGVQQVPPRLLEAASMLGTPAPQALYKVVLPSAAPSIVGGLRIAMGLSWVILVVGETVGISTGLGALITVAREQSRTDLIIAGMVVIGLAGFAADRFLVGLLRLVFRKRPILVS